MATTVATPTTWESLATGLLSSVSGNTISNVAGALEQGGMALNHFLKDDPVKLAKVERLYIASLEDYINQLRNLKEGSDASAIVVNLDNLITGK